ncbi:HlyD family efflux transporter periplasmic adaptor subunit [Desertifilum sp. FACHB-1129]|uniref:CusB-like beta-barrel domain-containing protein n=2 Tax=Desertifilum tharense IPPAS B-1220 TaxID=1781255 RepID=A0A1E5QNF7_9CYAN|nr:MULTISPECIES: HlyD family secretion protein [Desertifilum]MDA0210303.1 HlyD family efflux transporter periplasmic adaptor subunit [Cyanobacteria bacterium FC1]MBD2310249.1 HlyD family efflux transporter periplasmic adaptor subunit [Desertifilum sp. FACHB-1129]MBD2322625.1 HlyD family efflux transporter periplasmic adaptor subunit [Desertifilum sp. FACHB-866]MBD2333503.1 HlyD family efflux transporter periplasmic adaptor subunit [Desertifilum sp. FACHB-868]OEJ76170.1 hypothetical protein BH7
MNPQLQARFRQDLVIIPISEKGKTTKRYLIKNPASGETFEFGEEEYFLCCAVDGITSPTQIIEDFQARFSTALSPEDFQQFVRQISSLGLVETLDQHGPNLSASQVQSPPPDRSFELNWSLFNPARLFTLSSRLFRPWNYALKVGVWVLFPLLAIALFTLWSNRLLLWQDTVLLLEPKPFILQFIKNLLILNFTTKLLQGTVGYYQGATVQEFGITLGFGFLPFFYINKAEFWKLQRHKQVWIFGTPLIYRLFLIASGILIWHATRGTGTQLAASSLTLAHAAFTSLLIVGNPFWPSDGYGWMINFFYLPATSLQRAFRIWGMMLNRRRLPPLLTLKGRIGLVVYAAIAVLFWTVFFGYSATLLAASLQRNFRGSGVILFLSILPLFCLWCVWMTAKFGVKPQPASEQNFTAEEILATTPSVRELRPPSPSPQTTYIPFRQEPQYLAQPKTRWIRPLKSFLILFLIAGCIALLFLPYQYHTGGEIQLIAPQKQEIQAEIEGYIRQVKFRGGDGTWIEKGSVIAVMEAADIQNSFNTTQEAIKGQQALLLKQQANLAKLIAEPRPEVVEVAQEQLAVAQKQLNVSLKQLETQKVQAEASARRAARFRELWQEGVVSQQQWEDEQRQADIDLANQITTEEAIGTARQRLNEAQANLNLVLSGTNPKDIEAARQEIEVTRANISRLEQELSYLGTQIQSSQLFMPFRGQLTTAYLDRKIGTYLEKGDTFAIAESGDFIRGEVSVPEFQVDEISLNGQVFVKLLAYPKQTLTGSVVSIEPSAVTTTYGQVVKVVVELPNSENILKSGMTGYAKIQGRTMPVIMAFSRALLRFVLVEVWSWFP